ncbi:MAG: acyltransferase [Methylococcaceae bacterium]|nr:acyltransferase [Methylococcaceae bacterium]
MSVEKIRLDSRLSHIDSLRGIAVILVVWMHVAEVFVGLSPQTRESGGFLYDMARTVDFGRIGVVLFFSISGFVICKSLSGNVIKGGMNFLIRRFFRLFPAYWLSVPLGLVSVWWLFDKPISAKVALVGLTMTPSLFDTVPIMGHYWTLETELVFYVLCLALFILGILNRPQVLFFISLTCVVLSRFAYLILYMINYVFSFLSKP